jgi:hypothetical protein
VLAWFIERNFNGSCSEEAGSEGIMERGSASYRPSLEFQGGSFAAALHDALRIFMVSGRQSANGHRRLRTVDGIN